MSPVRTIVLDLDGPLLNGVHRHYTCYREILSENGFTPLIEDEYWRLKRARCSRRDILALSNATTMYDRFLSEWFGRIEDDRLLALDRLQDGVTSILSTWQQQRICLVLATLRHSTKGVERQLVNMGLAPFFDQVIVVDHLVGGGGKAEAVRRLIGSRHVRVWIGDTEVDVEAARALGCPSWIVACGLRDEECIRELRPDFMSTSLIDVDLTRVEKWWRSQS
jgi:phosphoglycolate phosphatase